MNRTTIVLPDDVKAQAIKQARVRGISFGELVREALHKFLDEPSEDATQRSRRESVAAMLRFGADAPAGPSDLSERLDDYLYGNPQERRNT